MSARGQKQLRDLATEMEVVGEVERVIFHNEENGFTVLRIIPEDEKAAPARDPLACVGHMVAPRQGMRLRLAGHYVKNPRYGRQLAFEIAEEVLPVGGADIAAYLSSGLIRGIGPGMAARIVHKFGEKTLDILDNEPQKLLEVYGIGKKILDQIIKSWNEHRGMRDLLMFLQPYGITAACAVRIYKIYGGEARMIVSENPFRLAMDIRGIGFRTADEIARKMGFGPEHPLRIQAATLYVLKKATDDGHVFLPEEELVKKVCQEVNTEPALAARAIASLERDKRVVCELLREDNGQEVMTGIYLSRFHHCESRTAFYLRRLLASPKSVRLDDTDSILAEALSRMPVILAPGQVEAVMAAARAKVLVITGGPGTGKTTIIKAIIRVFENARVRIFLAAPTGRAAKRMSEACGMEAKTIHRLLEYSPREDRFTRDEDNPLACGLLVIDEASMMDTLLFYYLLKAIPLGATLVLVGDVHQLPSVGPGNVLGDIIDSGAAPVARLNEIFRQSSESEIICNAHLINHGRMPHLEKNANRLSDFYFIPRDDPEEAADLIVDLVKNHIPRRFGFDPINDIQLLTPMHKGAVGSEHMNARLQEALNPNARQVRRGDRIFRLRDKVMQVRNNYDKDIFNGDIGVVTHIDEREKTLSVDFDGVIMPYEFDELDELVPAYAISIHKSQGSEYPAVVIPVMMQHYVLLQRNLVYTGVTRGKKLVILVGEHRALQTAINNNRTSKRYTWLAQRLAAGLKGRD